MSELIKGGWSRDQLLVRITNAEHVKYIPGFHVNEETEYSLWHKQSHSTTDVKFSRYVGTMDDMGVAKIARGFLRMDAHSKDMIPPKILKKIKLWLERVDHDT